MSNPRVVSHKAQAAANDMSYKENSVNTQINTKGVCDPNMSKGKTAAPCDEPQYEGTCQTNQYNSGCK